MSNTRQVAATLVLLVLLGVSLLAVDPWPVRAGAGEAGAAAAGPAGRLKQLPGRRGCIHKKGVNRCARARAISSPEDIVISPDGRHAYVAAYGSHSVAVFARDRRTGELRQLPGKRGCVRHRSAGAGSCAAGRALANPSSIAVSPDGRNVYVTALGSSAVAVFGRDGRTGALRQLTGAKGCVSQRAGGGCVIGRALNEPTAAAVSADGKFVYVTGRRFPSGLAAFARGRDGALAQDGGAAGCVTQGGSFGCTAGHAMRSPEDVVVSPDDRSVFVAGTNSNAVAVLRRGPEGLTQAPGAEGCIAKAAARGCALGHALTGAVDLAVTPNGKWLYVAGSISDAVAILRHDTATGALTQAPRKAGCIGQAGSARCTPGRALDEVWSTAVSPDGRNLYTVSAKTNALGIAARNRTTGSLAPLRGRLGCFIRGGVGGCPQGRGLTVAVEVTVSPDGRNVYVASEDAHLGAIAVFRRFPR